MRNLFLLFIYALISNLFLSAPSYGEEGGYTIEERSFTTTKLKLSDRCKEEKFNELCTRFSNYLISNYERNMVVRNNAHIDYDDPSSITPNLTQKEQTVEIVIREIKNLNFAIIEADIKQDIDGTSSEFVQCFNVNLTTGEYIRFSELFENSKLAAMLCARKIEKQFSENQTRALLATISLTEVNPTNFMLRPDGLEFLFAPNTVTTDGKQATVLVTLDELKRANPLAKWFPVIKAVTKDQ